MASKGRNMFYKKKKQETAEIGNISTLQGAEKILRELREGLMMSRLGGRSDDTYMYDDEMQRLGGHHWYDEPPYESDPEDFLMAETANHSRCISLQLHAFSRSLPIVYTCNGSEGRVFRQQFKGLSSLVHVTTVTTNQTAPLKTDGLRARDDTPRNLNNVGGLSEVRFSNKANLSFPSQLVEYERSAANIAETPLFFSVHTLQLLGLEVVNSTLPLKMSFCRVLKGSERGTP
ncbi:hypothetical protein AAG570_003890 [Ranatra chinensis]|uniref:Uncharacterized protein n=1 Tax=Ranatra chinensis TaxID=642074 RepID=A0ABD0YQP1_9HEMI